MIQQLAQEMKIGVQQVQNTVDLIDQGNTIPFIARYRKEMTGSLDDQVLRELSERLTYLRNLEKRKDEVKASIESQGMLDEALCAAIDSAVTLAEVEDLYRPFRPKRRTRASAAKEKGSRWRTNSSHRKSKAPLPRSWPPISSIRKKGSNRWKMPLRALRTSSPRWSPIPRRCARPCATF